MAKFDLEPLNAIDGFLGACLVDSSSGMMLGATGGGPVNLEVAAAGNTEVVRAKRKTMDSLKLDDQIEDILISLGKQYHIIRPLGSAAVLFLYIVMDRNKSNLAMARHEVRAFEKTLDLS
ncbi:MAG: roadblock/LC7 domain-containing protein [Acidobacteriota bacterium]